MSDCDCNCDWILKGLEDDKASYQGGSSAHIGDLVGRCVLFSTCGGNALIRVEELEIVPGLDNFLYISRLAGAVAWGDVDYEAIDIDNRSFIRKERLKPAKAFEDVVVGTPGSRDQVCVRRLCFQNLHAAGQEMVAIVDFDGVDLVTGEEIQWQAPPPPPKCSVILTLRCDTLFCQVSCDRTIKNVSGRRTLTDCTCPQDFFDNPIGFCWVGTWASCKNNSCKLPARCRVRFPHRCICC